MKKVFLFDLDSTLLQMDQDEFLKYYFGLIAKTVATKTDLDPKKFMDVFMLSAYNILKNDGSKTNEDYFWDDIEKSIPNARSLDKYFYDMYVNEFPKIKDLVVHQTKYPKMIVEELKNKGYQVVLCTNPLFPKVCTYERIRWTGLTHEDFLYVTTYENCTYCKPKKEYFIEVLNKLNINPSDCYMVGNDLIDDFIDLPSGITPILLTDYLINKKNLPITMKSFKAEELYNAIKNNELD